MDLILTLLRSFIFGMILGYIFGALFLSCEAHAQSVSIAEATEMAGRKYSIEPQLLRAVIQVESRGNPLAVGGVGEVGLMQLNPRSFSHPSFNVVSNVDMGAKYLAHLRTKCPYRAGYTFVVCYNKGLHPRDRNPRATHYYLAVMRAYNNESN